MSSHQVRIHASAAVVYRLLSDVGGWRIWNRRVAFSELDGDVQIGGRGVLYLRSIPWLPWSLHIEALTAEQNLTICANCLSVHVHICFDVQSDPSSEYVLLRGVLRSDSLLGRLASSKLVPFWHGFLAGALAGVRYAAESVSAAETHHRVK